MPDLRTRAAGTSEGCPTLRKLPCTAAGQQDQAADLLRRCLPIESLSSP